MYTREILESRPAPVENGIPLQGTWTRAFDEVDLLDIRKPYSFPLPKALKRFRVKEWESFIIQDENFFLQARLSNHKYYSSAIVIMYNFETKEKLEFNKVIPGSRWRLPKNLKNASLDSHSYGFFFRIHSWLDTNRIMLDLNIESTRKRPAFTAHVTFDLAKGKTVPIAVSLLFTEYRNMYAYKVLTGVEGEVFTGGQHIHFSPDKTSGLFCDFKGYYPIRSYSTWCSGMGFDEKNRRYGFSLGENQTREPFSNNENALWVDGSLTPLPPVKITQNGSYESDWIIQDMEGMVDLVFTPKEQKSSVHDYENTLGVFNGLLLNKEGEELPVRNAWGTGEKLYLRV